MVFFDFLSDPPEAPAAAHPAARNAIPAGDPRATLYNPDLVPQLVQEHRALMVLFGAVTRAYQAGDLSGVKRALQKFQMTFQLHMATEEAQLYAYLHGSLKKGSEEHARASAFRAETQGLGTVVSHFLRKYGAAELAPDLHARFGREAQHIAAELGALITREEGGLYGLYAPA